MALFQLSHPAGYVQHESPTGWLQWAGVSLSPLFWNITIGLITIQYAITDVSGTTAPAVVTGFALLWVGATSLVHALPSVTDIRNLWKATTQDILRLPLIIVVGPIYLIRIGIDKVGTFRATVPATIGVLISVGILYDISPLSVVTCLPRGHWGCWTTAEPLPTVASKPLNAIINAAVSFVEEYFDTIDISVKDESTPPVTPSND